MLKKICLFLLCCCLSNAAFAGFEREMAAGRDALRQKDVGRLQRIAEQMGEDPLAVYPRYWALLAQIDNVDDGQIRAFLNTEAGSLLADRLRGEWLRALGKAGRWDRFSEEWPLLVNSDLELNCYEMQARFARKDGDALRDARVLWMTGRDLPSACEPVWLVLRDANLLTDAVIWDRMRLAMEAGSSGLVRHLVALLPEDEVFAAKQFDAATVNPALMLRKSPPDLSHRGGRELLIYSLYRLARTDMDAAFAQWQASAAHLSKEERAYGWGQLAMVAARRLQPQALDWYKQADGAPLSTVQHEWKVRAALRAGNWAATQAAIEAMGADQQQDPAWRYWRGRALKALNRNVEAMALFAPLSLEHHFYGLLAREELSTVMDASAGRYLPNDAELSAAKRLPGIRRALALRDMDWRPEAVREWNWAMRGLEDQQLLAAADIAFKAGWYDRAIYAAERTRTIHDFSLRYLAPYRDITKEYASQLGMDEAWIYGLMRQESRFVSVARSGVGASGLMQLMPETTRWVARKLGIKRFKPEMANEIGVNVQFGTYYLNEILHSLGGYAVLATAGYNAGPGRARAWQDVRPLEGAIYAETIPFTETRDYVKKVMANAMYYAKTFNNPSITLKTRLGIIPGRGYAEPSFQEIVQPDPAGKDDAGGNQASQ